MQTQFFVSYLFTLKHVKDLCFGGKHSFTGLYKGAVVFNCLCLKLGRGVHCVCSLHFSCITIILTEKQNCLQTGSTFLGQ